MVGGSVGEGRRFVTVRCVTCAACYRCGREWGDGERHGRRLDDGETRDVSIALR